MPNDSCPTASCACSTSRSASRTSSSPPRTTPRSLGTHRDRRDERDGPRVFLKCWDEHEHHSVILRTAPTYGLDHMSFKVHDPRGPRPLSRTQLEAAGVAVKRFDSRRARARLGRGDPLRRPSGHRVELVYGMEQVGNMLPHDQPAAPSAGPGRHRAAAAGPRVRHGRGRRGVHRVLLRTARLPPHRADHRQRRPPARDLARALAHPARHRLHHRPERRAAPLRVLARRLERHARRRRRPRLPRGERSTSRRRGTA